jgi:hypothetical protein
MAERARAVRRVPQAIVKITSFQRTERRVRDTMRYISRQGKLALETETGEQITDLEEQDELLQDWASGFNWHPKSRNTVHLVFSMPWKSDPTALRETMRELLAERFKGQPALFVIHEDRQHPHAHVLMKMRAPGQKKLTFRKGELHLLRHAYAEIAQKHGVEMAVSPRAARGIGRKSDKLAVRKLRERGQVPLAEKETAREIVTDILGALGGEKVWEKAMRLRHSMERDAYANEAKRLRQLALKDVPNKDALLKVAAHLEAYSKELPVPKTLRQELLEDLRPKSSKDERLNGPDELSR